MSKYRKKPVVIDAFRLGYDSYPDWFTTARANGAVRLAMPECIIQTPDGEIRVLMGNYIIRGMMGEIHGCRSDIFEATYEPTEVQSE